MNNDALCIRMAIMLKLNEIQSNRPISNGNIEFSGSNMPWCDVLNGNYFTGGIHDFQFTGIQ